MPWKAGGPTRAPTSLRPLAPLLAGNYYLKCRTWVKPLRAARKPRAMLCSIAYSCTPPVQHRAMSQDFRAGEAIVAIPSLGRGRCGRGTAGFSRCMHPIVRSQT